MPAKYLGTFITPLNSNDSPSWGVSSNYLQEKEIRWIFLSIWIITYVLSIGGGGNGE